VRLWRRTSLLVAVAALAGVTPQLASAATSGLRLETTSLVKVPGSPLTLSLTLSRGPGFGGSAPPLRLQIARLAGDPASGTQQTELHEIAFTLPAGALVASFRKGMTLRLRTGAALGHWGKIDMSLVTTHPGQRGKERVSASCSAATTTFMGRLRGTFVLALAGMPTLRLRTLPIVLTEYPSVPACFVEADGGLTGPTIGPPLPIGGPCSTDSEPAASPFTALYAGDTLLDENGALLPAGGSVFFGSDLTVGSTQFGVSALGFLDPAATSAPASAYHVLVETRRTPIVAVDATGAATLTFAEQLLSGTLTYAPAAPPGPCDGETSSTGTLSGSLVGHFAWGGDRTFGDGVAATLFAPAPLPAPAPAP
jgi:hypothetical protein